MNESELAKANEKLETLLLQLEGSMMMTKKYIQEAQSLYQNFDNLTDKMRILGTLAQTFKDQNEVWSELNYALDVHRED